MLVLAIGYNVNDGNNGNNGNSGQSSYLPAVPTTGEIISDEFRQTIKQTIL